MSNRRPIQVLVTGGSGFLGSNIVKGILSKHPQWQVSILDLKPPKPSLSSRITSFIEADITSESSVSSAFESFRPDLVIHTAGIVPARTSRYSTREADWERIKLINYKGTQHIVDAARAAGCRRLVYTSSCTVVVDDLHHDYYNVDEKVILGHAHLHYGKSKALAETYVLSSSQAATSDINSNEDEFLTCALRPSTIIGPGDVAVICLIHDLIAKGETYFIVGDGDNFYDFVYIDNVVQAHILAAENLLSSRPTAAGHAFNISNMEPVYFWDFLAAVWAQFGHVPRFRIHIPMSIAWFAGFVLEWLTWLTGGASTLDRGSVQDGVRTHYANNAKAVTMLGYQPTVGLAEGVRRSCDDYKKYLAQQQENDKSKKER